jgi:hypothetical protein
VVASREGVGVVAVFSFCAFIASAEVDFDDGIHEKARCALRVAVACGLTAVPY